MSSGTHMKYYRMINDTIHGSFYLHKLLWQIIDTHEFQRLRNIRQTGNTHYVYDGANQTRFEHSIGVAHLCDVFANKLRIKLQDQNPVLVDKLLDSKTILCLQIAGLCHDLGHCAYSHLFDGAVIPYFDADSHFHHEQASYMILCRLYNRMEANFNKYGITMDEIKFVGKLILGSPSKVPNALKNVLVWNDWDKGRQFLYQIISDDFAGIDVDKFDYIKRDCHNTGITTGFDPQRLMEFAYIDIDEEDRYPLKYLPKAEELIREMWESRANLHRRVYQHRVVKCFDEMTLEIFKLVGSHLKINGVPLSEVHKHMESYLLVTDHIVTVIKFMDSDEPDVIEAQTLIARMECRDIWSTVFAVTSPREIMLDDYKITDKVAVCHAHVGDDWIYYFYEKNKLTESDRVGLMKLLCSLEKVTQVKIQ